ncbi:hypothetical protein PIB30_033870 [Stylosanthes scabra]|uniref:F-box domain-containing protein n=1 Tax=Stylosanthes scabra TaxID=79078 RepID=A0ABU6SDE0_9FABA|nr:hypothetical protein [Stylosanthes scabra]
MAEGDRICGLPDQVLFDILSRLPSTTVVRTSILSNRWKNLWHSVPTVDLDSALFNEAFLPGTLFSRPNNPKFRFLRFASSLILSLVRDGKQAILNFRLTCKNGTLCDYSYLKLWIDAAVQRSVEKIEISLPSATAIKLPRSIVTCHTLVVLKIEQLIVDLGGSVVQLPRLKTLHIDGAVFAKPLHLCLLLNGCPNLEDLKIKSLTLWHDGDGDSIPYVSGLNYSFPKLMRADVSSMYLRLEYVTRTFVTFGNLIHMKLCMFDCKWGLLVRLLGFCPVLRILHVDEASDERSALGLKNEPVPDCMSRLRECTITNFKSVDADMEFATYIMQNASVLLRMTIRSTSSLSQEERMGLLQDLFIIPRISRACLVIFK